MPVARQRIGGAGAHGGDRVADAGLLDFLDLRGDEADLAGGEAGDFGALGGEAADAVDQVAGAALHELDLEALGEGAVHYPDENDDAEVGIVPGVDDHCAQGGGAVAGGGRDALDHSFEHFGDADPGLRAGEDGVAGVEADDLLDLGADFLGLGGGEVDLVDDGDDLVVVLDRLVDVGEGLRFDALRCVDHEQRAFAGGEAARNLVGEVDVAGGVHQVQLVGLTVACGVAEADGLGLDGDPALALNVHVIKDLLAHLAVRQPAGGLDQPVGEGRLAMVDVGDNAEVADVGEIGHPRPLAT